jgi:hypothetical protein
MCACALRQWNFVTMLRRSLCLLNLLQLVVYERHTVKLFLCLTDHTLHHEDACDRSCIDSLSFGFSTTWRWTVSFTILPLYLLYPLNGRLGGPHSQYGRNGEVTNLDPTGTRTQLRVVEPVASRYTDWANPAPCCFKVLCIIAETLETPVSK